MLNRGAPIAKVDLRSFTTDQGEQNYTLDQDVVDVLEAVIRVDDNEDIALGRVSLDDWLKQPVKDQQSRPTQFVTKRNKDDVVMTLWPVPQVDSVGTEYEIFYYAITRIADVNGPRDNADFNFRYLPSIVSRTCILFKFTNCYRF